MGGFWVQVKMERSWLLSSTYRRRGDTELVGNRRDSCLKILHVGFSHSYAAVWVWMPRQIISIKFYEPDAWYKTSQPGLRFSQQCEYWLEQGAMRFFFFFFFLHDLAIPCFSHHRAVLVIFFLQCTWCKGRRARTWELERASNSNYMKIHIKNACYLWFLLKNTSKKQNKKTQTSVAVCSLCGECKERAVLLWFFFFFSPSYFFANTVTGASILALTDENSTQPESTTI